MDDELDKLQKKAREIRARDEEAEDRQAPRKSKRSSPLRILIWVAEGLILVFAIEHFIVSPWLARRAAERRVNEETAPTGTPVPVLGDKALALTGLREVTEASLPRVDDLAPGSQAAQQGQVLVSGDYRLPIEVENSVGMRFRLIPEGTFLMGSPPSEKQRWEGERQHVRTISRPFYMGKTEVTQKQWRAVMSANPAYFKSSQRPVEEVTWSDCQNFVLALCEMEGVPKYTYRLPSEVEWEYAGRAGTQTAYFFGNNPAHLRRFDWYDDNSGGESAPVARLRPNAFGLYDMQGNVWEWCQNLFAPYPGTNDAGIVDGDYYSIRGGNWYVQAQDCRLAERTRLPPDSHGNMLGLRVMRMIPEWTDSAKDEDDTE